MGMTLLKIILLYFVGTYRFWWHSDWWGHIFLFRLSVYKMIKICSFISALLHAQNHRAAEERVHTMSERPQHVELLSHCKHVVYYNAVTQRQLLWHVCIACSRNIVVQAKTTSLPGKMIEIARIEVLTAVLLRLKVFWDVTPCRLVISYWSSGA
jgi:hypothetical protein